MQNYQATATITVQGEFGNAATAEDHFRKDIADSIKKALPNASSISIGKAKVVSSLTGKLPTGKAKKAAELKAKDSTSSKITVEKKAKKIDAKKAKEAEVADTKDVDPRKVKKESKKAAVEAKKKAESKTKKTADAPAQRGRPKKTGAIKAKAAQTTAKPKGKQKKAA